MARAKVTTYNVLGIGALVVDITVKTGVCHCSTRTYIEHPFKCIPLIAAVEAPLRWMHGRR
jgi:hypothetical protein